MLRVLNMIVIAALVVAATWVYEIKYSSTAQAERVAKLRADIRRERDAIAALRAEWGELDSPNRIEGLAKRHLNLQPVVSIQFDRLDTLPDKPIQIVPPGTTDPIGALIELTVDPEVVTGAVPGDAQ
jgi:cell division protein FtsL